MKVHYKNREFIVRFEYVENLTIAKLLTRTSDGMVHLIADATSECHHKDQFNRVVGRKIAFERLMSVVKNPELRKAFWQTFLSTHKVWSNSQKKPVLVSQPPASSPVGISRRAESIRDWHKRLAELAFAPSPGIPQNGYMIPEQLVALLRNSPRND